MEKIQNIIDYIKGHSWDYIDAALGGIIAILLLTILLDKMNFNRMKVENDKRVWLKKDKYAL